MVLREGVVIYHRKRITKMESLKKFKYKDYRKKSEPKKKRKQKTTAFNMFGGKYPWY